MKDKVVTVKDIVSDWLAENNYDGLYKEDCACKLDDLMPCDCENISECQVGYLMRGQKWCIGPKKSKSPSSE